MIKSYHPEVAMNNEREYKKAIQEGKRNNEEEKKESELPVNK
jgi:hypothetical protein